MSPKIQLQKIFWFASLYQKPGETSFVYTLKLKENIKEKEEKIIIIVSGVLLSTQVLSFYNQKEVHVMQSKESANVRINCSNGIDFQDSCKLALQSNVLILTNSTTFIILCLGL